MTSHSDDSHVRVSRGGNRRDDDSHDGSDVEGPGRADLAIQ